MDVRKLMVTITIAAICVAGFAGVSHARTAGAAAVASATQSAGSAAQYKIGIVDRRVVLQGYNKVSEERSKLESDVKRENEEIDKMADDLQAAKEAYDNARDSMTAIEREDRELAIQRQFMQYQTKLQTKQAEVDERERRLMQRFFTDIDDAVRRVGDAENYHLIIDGSKGSSTLFYAPAMDISQRVIDELNRPAAN